MVKTNWVWSALFTSSILLLAACSRITAQPTPRTQTAARTPESQPIATEITNPEPEEPALEPTELAAGLTIPYGLGDPIYPFLGNDGYDVQHYDIDLTIAAEANTISGSVKITAVATEPLQTIMFDLSGLKVFQVTIDESLAQFDHQETKLVITPEEEIAEGASFSAVIQYAGSPVVINDPSATYPLGWQPQEGGSFVISEPTGAMNWFPNNNHPSDKATYTMRFTLSQPYGIVANGVLTDFQQNGYQTVYEWQMEQPMASYLAVAQVNDYEVAVDVTDSGVPIRNYFPKNTSEAVRKTFAVTPDMINFMEDTIGPYPFNQYGVVLLTEPTRWTLESQSVSTYGSNGPSREEAVMHELALQWFGNSVSIATWQDNWLNEGFATYFENLWMDYTGAITIEASMADLYDSITATNMGSPIPDTAADLFSPAVYWRGAYTLHALRESVGDEVFFEILQTYYDRFAGGNASTADFMAVAGEIGGDKAVAVLTEWLYSDTVPSSE